MARTATLDAMRCSTSMTVRMDRNLRAALEDRARRQHRSMASVVRRALRDALAADPQLSLPLDACAHPMTRRYRDRCTDCGQVVGAAAA